MSGRAITTLDPTVEERFWHCVQRSEGCWLWTGPTSSSYGALINDGRQEYAHRLSWVIHGGELPDDLWVLHKCDTPLCVRFDHLFLGTQADNMQDCKSKGRLSPPPVHRGFDQHLATLTDAEVEEVRAAVAHGETQRAVATRFGVSQSTVWRLAHRIVR